MSYDDYEIEEQSEQEGYFIADRFYNILMAQESDDVTLVELMAKELYNEVIRKDIQFYKSIGLLNSLELEHNFINFFKANVKFDI